MQKTFSCDKCHHTWTDSHNISPCPKCGGLGPKDPACTCLHVRIGLLGQVQQRTSTDPNCPVHAVYVPKFPEHHRLLFEAYREAMAEGEKEEVIARCENLKSLVEGWLAKKKQGGLPEGFFKSFWHDADDARGEVQKGLNLDRLPSPQKRMPEFIFNFSCQTGRP